MGLDGGGGGGTDLMVDEGSGGEEMLDNSSSSVSCSICLDEVLNKGGDRSRVILQCGHEFHLDCIGSMFNSKGGVMQCPNCRKTEKGQWLFTDGSHSSSFSEFNLVDWAHDDDLYDLTYSEMPYGVHWCPFRGLTPISSSFEEPTAVFQDLLGHNAVLAEHGTVSSGSHSCPYVAIFQPLLASSTNSNERVNNTPSSNHQWTGLSGPNEMSSSHRFPAGDIHYQVWDHHSPPYSATSSHVGAVDQGSVPSAAIRHSRGDSDGPPRSVPVVHPFFVDQGSGSRAGTSIVPSMVPPYACVSSRAHDRVEGVHQHHHHHHQPQSHPRAPMFSNVRRSSGPRGAPPVTQPPSSSEYGGNFYMLPPSGSSGRNLQETVNPSHSHFSAWERDRFAPFPLVPVERELSWWPPHLAAGGSEPGSRANGHWHRHGSERTLSQGRPPPPHPPGQMHPLPPPHPPGQMHPLPPPHPPGQMHPFNR